MSNNYGEMEVLKKVNNKEVIVRFINTGYLRKANIGNVKAGKVKDFSVKHKQTTKTYNQVWFSNSCGPYIIFEKTGKTALIQFIETGFTRKVNIDNAKVGKVRDPYSISVYNKGYDGEFQKVYYWKRARQLWQNMMKRCYCEKDPRGYFKKGVTVDDRWLCFANFLVDLPTLHNFQGWLEGFEEGKTKYNLDKDFLVEGNKVYSREMCQFIADSENKSAGSLSYWKRHKRNDVGKD